MANPAFRTEARACQIHGIIRMSPHPISTSEIARRLRLPRESVRDVVRKRKWNVSDGRQAPEGFINFDPVELAFD